jgi:hypothetical protein
MVMLSAEPNIGLHPEPDRSRLHLSAVFLSNHTHTHTHTHTQTCFIYPAIVGSTGGRLLLEFSGVGPSHSIWYPHWLRNVSLEVHIQSKEQPKVSLSEIRIVRWLGEEREVCLGEELLHNSDVWLGALSCCRNHCPCLPLVAPLPPNCITQPLQKLHVEMTSNCLGGTNSWCTKPSISNNSGNFLTASRMPTTLSRLPNYDPQEKLLHILINYDSRLQRWHQPWPLGDVMVKPLLIYAIQARKNMTWWHGKGSVGKTAAEIFEVQFPINFSSLICATYSAYLIICYVIILFTVQVIKLLNM